METLTRHKPSLATGHVRAALKKVVKRVEYELQPGTRTIEPAINDYL